MEYFFKIDLQFRCEDAFSSILSYSHGSIYHFLTKSQPFCHLLITLSLVEDNSTAHVISSVLISDKMRHVNKEWLCKLIKLKHSDWNRLGDNHLTNFTSRGRNCYIWGWQSDFLCWHSCSIKRIHPLLWNT